MIKVSNKRILYSALVDRIEPLIDLDEPCIASKYMSWDKGDCSMIGLVKILLIQLIMEHKTDNDADGEYDVLLSILNGTAR